MDFAGTLLHWYEENKRPLPFRATTDPYKIWLSEIILQQTRVEQGMPYYHSFTNTYPNIVDLANAHEDAVMRLWQGLGYYSRARNLHQTAKIIATEYKGQFPSTYAEIAGLKGIGPYTAGAIASIAFGEKAAAVDGNVYRFLSRYFGITTPTPSEKARKEFTAIVLDLMGNHHSGTFNQALIEFGALQCKPSPNCGTCPFSQTCYAFKKDRVATLPVKNKMAARRTRYFNYLIIKNNKQLLLQQRTAKDIWQQLYEFPLVETTEPAEWNTISKELGYAKTLHLQGVVGPVKHVLSHQDILATFYIVETKGNLPEWQKAFAVNTEDIDNYGLPRVITLFLEKNTL